MAKKHKNKHVQRTYQKNPHMTTVPKTTIPAISRLEKVHLKQDVDLLMPENVFNQIKYLCEEISTVEWSGVLFYSTEGSIQDPENFSIKLETILPLHKGDTGSTEYSFDERVVTYMMDNETMEKGWKIAHIHSHHTMGVFFSATDWSELEDNAPNHNVYLSLIVNNKMDFCAKIVYIAKPAVKGTIEYTAFNENGESYVYAIEDSFTAKDKLVCHDCDITVEGAFVEDEFAVQVAQIIKDAVPTYTYKGYGASTPTTGAKTFQQKPFTNVGTTPTVGTPKVEGFSTHEEFGDWGDKAFETTPFKEGGTGLIKTDEAELIPDTFLEDFAFCWLNDDNPAHIFSDIEDALRGIESPNIPQLVGSITESYAIYFKDIPMYLQDMDCFSYALQAIINRLDSVTLASVARKAEVMSKGLQQVLNKLTLEQSK